MLTRESMQFIRYLIKTNLRLYITVWIGLFIVLPFIIGITVQSESVDFAYMVSMFWGHFLVFAIPIYFWQFLYKKRSADLYYSLPIKRSHLFYIIFFTGYIMGVLPALLNMFFISFASEMLFGAIIGALICMFVVYAIVTWVAQQCNNLVDAIIISICFLVVPLIFVLSGVVFINNQYNSFMIGTGSYALEFPLAQLIPMGISAAYGLSQLFLSFLQRNVDFLLAIYWIGVALLCMKFANRSFGKRKQEDSEQRTNVWWTYPGIIFSITSSLILMIINGETEGSIITDGSIILSVCAFILYLCMVFFSNRKIKITRYNLMLFFGVYIGCVGISFIFQETKGFQIIQEVPNSENIKHVAVTFAHFSDNYDEKIEPIQITYESADGTKKKISVETLLGKSQGQIDIEELVNQQEGLIQKQKEVLNQTVLPKKYYFSTKKYYFLYQYNLKNGKTIYRNYHTNKEEATKILTNVFTKNAKKETTFKLEFKQLFEDI